jgi:hypothetical protein
MEQIAARSPGSDFRTRYGRVLTIGTLSVDGKRTIVGAQKAV